MIIRTFKQAEVYLALHIPKQIQQRFPGELGLKRAKYFLHLLGDPQEKLKIIHVAGTSGKGSTCYLISSLLEPQGFKVGFHQSPHLIDVRERFQINNKIISKEEFIFYLNKIISIIDIVERTFHGPPTYFEILVGLAYFIFSEKEVDYAVIETGLGGWYDATNSVERPDKLAVLTKIGLDHVAILGKTIQEIAFQKAMIINKNSQAISIKQVSEAEKVIKQVAEKKQAKIYFVSKSSFRSPFSEERNPAKRYDLRSRSLTSFEMTKNLGLIGDYQKENAGLALTVVNFLSKRDGFLINKKQTALVFSKAYFPGRFDVKKINGKTVIFDGAHNPQKIVAFINALIKEYSDKKFNFLIAFKFGKDYKKMLKIIIPWADSIILTSFFTENQDMINLSEKPSIVSQQLKKLGFTNFEVIPSLRKALEFILNKKEPIVVTGSLYLLGEIYRLLKRKKS